MWILSAAGDLLQGKRIWLRPGTIHLLGRTSAKGDKETITYINDNTVSRKHLLIEVAKADDNDAGRLHVKHGLSLTDSSAAGTRVNGNMIRKETKIFEEDHCELKLGKNDVTFRVEWKPIVISHISRKSKEKEKLSGTGIKIVNEIVSSSSTHIIAKTRNSPPALQALALGRWVVTEDFVNALAKATKVESSPNGKDLAVSALEIDFDANWPDETRFSVPPGGEPVRREDHYLKPNLERAEVFQDFTFIFQSQRQYKSLLPVITSSGGKALLYEVTPEATTPDELVTFITNTAGHKAQGSQFRLTQLSDKGGVVVVRHVDESDWEKGFTKTVDAQLGQHSINQRDFLDAILTLDTSYFRRPVPRTSLIQADIPNEAAMSEPEPVPASPSTKVQSAQPQNAAEDNPPPLLSDLPSRRRARRVMAGSRFKGFDDIDPSQFDDGASAPTPASREPSQLPNSQIMDVDDQRSVGVSQKAGDDRSTRKRAAPLEPIKAEDDLRDEILTAHAQFKKRRLLESGAKGMKSSTSREATPTSGERAKAKKGKQATLDVKAELQKQRAAEKQRQEEEEGVWDDDVDIKDLKNLAIIEEMELPVRHSPAHTTSTNARSSRWKPEWDGRKNFKKFRRQGQPAPNANTRSRIIVEFEEARPDQGPGQVDWPILPSPPARSQPRKNKSQKSNTQQSVTVVADSIDSTTHIVIDANADDEEDDRTAFRRRVQRSLEDDAQDAELQALLPDEIAGTARDADLREAMISSARQTSAKRPAKAQGGGPVKKPRAAATAVATAAPGRRSQPVSLDDESDEDELKFRRRR